MSGEGVRNADRASRFPGRFCAAKGRRADGGRLGGSHVRVRTRPVEIRVRRGLRERPRRRVPDTGQRQLRARRTRGELG